LAIAALTLGLIVLIASLALVGAAHADPPNPSPSPSATATPAPEPASPELVSWALTWRKAARSARARLCRVREAFGDRMPVWVGGTPQRAADAEEWTYAGRHWKHQAKDWRAKVKAGIAKLRRPGGAGAARWWPAAVYCGWPQHLKGWFCYVVWRESSARAHAVNSSSGCYGLLQLHPCHWASKGRAWISDVLNQLRLGWQLYRQYGPSPWALT